MWAGKKLIKALEVSLHLWVGQRIRMEDYTYKNVLWDCSRKDLSSCHCSAETAESRHCCGLIPPVSRELDTSPTKLTGERIPPQTCFLRLFLAELKSQACEVGHIQSHACALWKVKFRALPPWDWPRKSGITPNTVGWLNSDPLKHPCPNLGNPRMC